MWAESRVNIIVLLYSLLEFYIVTRLAAKCTPNASCIPNNAEIFCSTCGRRHDDVIVVILPC